jgi:ABC-type transporter Mla MlaB component
MLRLNRCDADGVSTIIAEGKLLAAWVGEVRDVFAGLRGRRCRLNLSAVSFVDTEGASLLTELQRDGVEIVASTPFVTQLLERQAR